MGSRLTMFHTDLTICQFYYSLLLFIPTLQAERQKATALYKEEVKIFRIRLADDKG